MASEYPLANGKTPFYLQKVAKPSFTELLLDASPSTDDSHAATTTMATRATGSPAGRPTRQSKQSPLQKTDTSSPGRKRTIDEAIPTLEQNSPQKPAQKKKVKSISLSNDLPSPVDPALELDAVGAMLRRYSALPASFQSLLMLDFLRGSRHLTLQTASGFIAPALRKDFLTTLPQEISHQILSHLEVSDLCVCSKVSKNWNKVIGQDGLIWRDKIIAQGWEYRMIRDLSHLATARSSLLPSRLPTSYTHAAEISNFYHGTPMRISSKAVLVDPISLFPTLAEMYKYSGTDDLIVCVYKLMYAHYDIMRRNWLFGTCNRLTFQAFDGNVITNLKIDVDQIICGSDNNTIGIFDISTGTEKYMLDGHDGGVWCLETCGPGNNTLISGSTDRTVRVWDIARGECLQILKGHSSTIRCLLLLPALDSDPDDHEERKPYWVITGARDATIRVWEIYLAPPPPVAGEPDPYAKEKRKSSTSSGSSTTKTNAESVRTRTTGPIAAPVARPAVMDDRMRDAIREAARNGAEAEANVVAARRAAVEVGVVAPNDDDESGDEDDSDDDNDEDEGDEDIVEPPAPIVETEGFLFTLSGHTNSVRAMAAHGHIVVSGSYDTSLRVWDLRTKECLHVLEGHDNKVYSLVYDWRHDRAISGSMDFTIRIWSTLTGQCLNVLDSHGGLVGLMQMEMCSFVPKYPVHAFSDEGRLSRNEAFVPLLKENVKSMLATRDHEESSYPSRSRKFPVLVSAAADSTLKIWDGNKNTLIHTLYGHRTSITCFQFDNDKLISGGEGHIKIWDMRTGVFVRNLVNEIDGAWKVAINERYCVCAVQRGNLTWFEILDFGVAYVSPQRRLN